MFDLNPNIEAGKQYVLDEQYNNASVVTVYEVGKIYAHVTDGNATWSVTKSRLTEKSDANRFIWERAN